MLSENFNSKSIQAHYESSKKLAIAFLFTAGAKALVISEQKFLQSGAFIGTNIEAEMRQEIVNEEKVRVIKRKLSEKNAIQVYKNGRNGKLRSIRIKVKHDSSSICFVWRSKNNLKKYFIFDKQTTVQPLTNAPADSLIECYSKFKSSISYSYLSSSFDQQTLPFLRFQNSDRVLDIRFNNIHEMEACLELVQLYSPTLWQSFSTTTPPPLYPNKL